MIVAPCAGFGEGCGTAASLSDRRADLVAQVIQRAAGRVLDRRLIQAGTFSELLAGFLERVAMVNPRLSAVRSKTRPKSAWMRL